MSNVRRRTRDRSTALPLQWPRSGSECMPCFGPRHSKLALLPLRVQPAPANIGCALLAPSGFSSVLCHVGSRVLGQHVHTLAWAVRPASWRPANLRGTPAPSQARVPCSWLACSGTLHHMSQRQCSSAGPRALGSARSSSNSKPAPNPSIERTANSQLRCLSPAAHVKR